EGWGGGGGGADHMRRGPGAAETNRPQVTAGGLGISRLKDMGPVQNRRGTTVRFHPDPQIFGPHAHFKPAVLYRMARSKAYLFRGVEIRWLCDPAVPRPEGVPQEERLHFPGGLADYLAASLADRATLTPKPFIGH